MFCRIYTLPDRPPTRSMPLGGVLSEQAEGKHLE
jgi:hypothetical protein